MNERMGSEGAMGMKNTSQEPNGRWLWCHAAGGREVEKILEASPNICHVFLSELPANRWPEPAVCSHGLKAFSWIGWVVFLGFALLPCRPCPGMGRELRLLRLLDRGGTGRSREDA
jgi:hypothetical protein